MAFNKKNALTLGIKAALRQGYTDGTSNFSCENVNDAFRDQVKELVGDYSLFRRNKLDFYELIEEIYAGFFLKRFFRITAFLLRFRLLDMVRRLLLRRSWVAHVVSLS